MYGGNPTYKPGQKNTKISSITIENFDNYIPRTPGANPKKGKLISAFPVGEKRCRVRKAAYDEQTKMLYIVLSEAISEDVYASVQIYQLKASQRFIALFLIVICSNRSDISNLSSCKGFKNQKCVYVQYKKYFKSTLVTKGPSHFVVQIESSCFLT